MFEIVGNLHLHTTASDGTGTFDEVATAAARAGLDFIVHTDHNISLEGIEGWYHDPETGRDVLRLMGQEVNDPRRDPEVNHLLCCFAPFELSHVASDPQLLIDTIIDNDGLCFLAHPLERPGYGAAEVVYPWVDWDINNYTGIELWNAMTDVKWELRTIPRGFTGAYFPKFAIAQPFPELLAKWDDLLCSTGRKLVAIGNSDAHAMSFRVYGITRTIFPYEHIFRCVNTRLLLDAPLSRQLNKARQQIRSALRAGHCFISYDLLAPPRGFRFVGKSGDQQAIIGDSLPLDKTATLYISSPRKAKLRLIHNGQLIIETYNSFLHWSVTQPGVYRVEAYHHVWGKERGWVFTNPIYIE